MPEQQIPASLERAYDPERFRAEGHRLVDRLSDYLHAARAGSIPVLPWVTPDASLAAWPPVGAEGFSAEPLHVFDRFIAEANHLHHPMHLGHQVACPTPLGALADLAAALLNNGMAVYEHGPSGAAMECHVAQWMAARLGWGPSAGGVFTSGGSAGNLTALLAMRQGALREQDPWNTGSGEEAPAVLVSEHAHYSVQRAVRIMGWGKGGAALVPVDEHLRLRPDALARTLSKARTSGRTVIGVVANACCTPTGAFDPLEAIADFCREEGLWLHVDGAHGAAACLSSRHRGLLRGIERADSVVWDAHKLMMMPALCTAVLFRHAGDGYAAFAQHASYLFSEAAEQEWYSLGQRTLECTKQSMILKLYTALACYGEEAFADYVDRVFGLGELFAEVLGEADDFELAVPPQSNIVCYRYLGDGRPLAAAKLDTLQTALRERLLASGRAYIVQTRLPKGVYLRSALMNPFTTEAHLRALLDRIREAAQPVLGD